MALLGGLLQTALFAMLAGLGAKLIGTSAAQVGTASQPVLPSSAVAGDTCRRHLGPCNHVLAASCLTKEPSCCHAARPGTHRRHLMPLSFCTGSLCGRHGCHEQHLNRGQGADRLPRAEHAAGADHDRHAHHAGKSQRTACSCGCALRPAAVVRRCSHGTCSRGRCRQPQRSLTSTHPLGGVGGRRALPYPRQAASSAAGPLRACLLVCNCWHRHPPVPTHCPCRTAWLASSLPSCRCWPLPPAAPALTSRCSSQ